jgi:hypothetical protein
VTAQLRLAQLRGSVTSGLPSCHHSLGHMSRPACLSALADRGAEEMTDAPAARNGEFLIGDVPALTVRAARAGVGVLGGIVYLRLESSLVATVRSFAEQRKNGFGPAVAA